MTVDLKNALLASEAEAVSAGLNAPVGVNDRVCGGIPLRLHIAAQFMATCARDVSATYIRNCAEECLGMADTLIAAHNETCGDK